MMSAGRFSVMVGFVLAVWSRHASSVLGTNTSTAIFVFGDSLVDVGNNNYLRRSLALANMLPNGIDFPTPNAAHPTGRFTNGLTIADIIGLELGLPNFPPPVLAPSTRGAAILNGVNYASASSGVFNGTGITYVDYISNDQQLDYFEGTLEELNAILGIEATQRYLAQAIFAFTTGSNDFIGNYLLTIPLTPEGRLPPYVFIQKMIALYRGQIMRLYKGGARKMVVVNVPVIGCTPNLRSTNFGTDGQCSSRANKLVVSYNAALQTMLQQLNQQLPGATVLHADAYGISAYIIQNYKAFGFENVETACCGLAGSEQGIVPCAFSFVPLCSNRGAYFFWDPFHPSENVNRIVASEFLQGSRFISPINIRQLVAL